jgi:hypothetical protein
LVEQTGSDPHQALAQDGLCAIIREGDPVSGPDIDLRQPVFHEAVAGKQPPVSSEDGRRDVHELQSGYDGAGLPPPEAAEQKRRAGKM